MSSYSYLKEFITPRDSWMVGLIKKTPHEDKLLQSLKALNSPLQAIWKLKVFKNILRKVVSESILNILFNRKVIHGLDFHLLLAADFMTSYSY